ncbi:hypothetical protein E2C01_059126 [Portunus trituberculatus]|uniref:Uncharacterized protein n=1 Tax=Portunus trituberculatus TaxID=210409 RepID=A0A5B7H4J7_PORTR|nr:hypothetical protein [Portunus trituberculatus]
MGTRGLAGRRVEFRCTARHACWNPTEALIPRPSSSAATVASSSSSSSSTQAASTTNAPHNAAAPTHSLIACDSHTTNDSYCPHPPPTHTET